MRDGEFWAVRFDVSVLAASEVDHFNKLLSRFKRGLSQSESIRDLNNKDVRQSRCSDVALKLLNRLLNRK